MRTEASYGIVPLQKQDGGWRVLLVQHHSGHWTFPKGHKEGEENDLEAATRELQEETGLVLTSWLCQTPFLETYFFRMKGELIHKTAYYYPALVSGTLKLQAQEVIQGSWVDLLEAPAHLTYKPTQEVAEQVLSFLNN